MRIFAPKEILCPIDMGPASPAVLSWARLLAQVFHARVEVFHAYWFEAPRYFTEGQMETLRSQMDRQREILEREVRKLAGQHLGVQVPFTVSIVEHHAVDVILNRLRTNPPDLIVMGSHGRSGVSRLLLGSVAENVAHEARCPVVIVKGSEIPPEKNRLNRILCPVHSIGDIRTCSISAADLARVFGAELIVLHVSEETDAYDQEQEEQFCQRISDEARSRCHITEISRKGNAAEQIVLSAREQSVDLTMIDSGHKSILDSRSLGRTAVAVMRHSSNSVLLVPMASS